MSTLEKLRRLNYTEIKYSFFFVIYLYLFLMKFHWFYWTFSLFLWYLRFYRTAYLVSRIKFTVVVLKRRFSCRVHLSNRFWQGCYNRGTLTSTNRTFFHSSQTFETNFAQFMSTGENHFCSDPAEGTITLQFSNNWPEHIDFIWLLGHLLF